MEAYTHPCELSSKAARALAARTRNLPPLRGTRARLEPKHEPVLSQRIETNVNYLAQTPRVRDGVCSASGMTNG